MKADFVWTSSERAARVAEREGGQGGQEGQEGPHSSWISEKGRRGTVSARDFQLIAPV